MTTILLIDDSNLVLMSFKMMLEASGYHLVTCADGKSALAEIASGLKPDVILTDFNMPGMNGIELVRAVRARLRFTPIVVVTTESQLAKKDEAKLAGATGWLIKPVKPDDLLNVIQRVMLRAAG